METKTVIYPKMRTQRKTFRNFALGGDENVSSIDGETLLGTSCKNCFFDSGLNAGIFAKELALNLPAFTEVAENNGLGPQRFFSFGAMGEEKFGYVMGNGIVYAYDETENAYKPKHIGIGEAKIVEYTDKVGYKRAAFFSEKGVNVFDGTNFTNVYFDGTARFGVYTAERLFFVTDGDYLRYSAPLNEKDITVSADEGGYLQMRALTGEIVGLAEFDGVVYVFHKFGIEKLTVNGSARDFVRETVCYQGGEILLGSAVRGEDGVYFMARDGVWFFDGNKSVNLCRAYPITLVGEQFDCRAFFNDGKYFARCYFNRGKEVGWICFDVRLNKWTTVNLPKSLHLVGGKMLLYVRPSRCVEVVVSCYDAARNDSVYVFDHFFEVKQTDFGVDTFKTIEKIEFVGSGEIAVNICSDYGCQTRSITLGDAKATMPVMMKGEKFSLKIMLSKGALIKEMTVQCTFVKK